VESYSRRLLPLIEWEPTPEFNVRGLALDGAGFDIVPKKDKPDTDRP
jgi:hypothetical protein